MKKNNERLGDVNISLKTEGGEKYIIFSGLFNMKLKANENDIEFMGETLLHFKNNDVNITPIFSSNPEFRDNIEMQRSS